jgi:CRISPR-associated protein Cas1
MYRMRFSRAVAEDLTLEQIRGMEGVRVREAYARMSKQTGVAWKGRLYAPGDWERADPVNRALSAANACLHALCHSAIAIAGYSESLGFIHTGKTRAFVYDIADLYKVDLTVPIAFRCATDASSGLESRVRRMCRAAFYSSNLLERIIPDVQRALGQKVEPAAEYSAQDLSQDVLDLWDPSAGAVTGGQNYAGSEGDIDVEMGADGSDRSDADEGDLDDSAAASDGLDDEVPF